MKIVTFEYDNDVQVGIISEDGKFVIPANKYETMYDLIQQTDFEELLAIARVDMGAVPLDQVKILAPITHPRNDIICLGINYNPTTMNCLMNTCRKKSYSARCPCTSPNGWTGQWIRRAPSTAISMW